jgi:hypothetical protein
MGGFISRLTIGRKSILRRDGKRWSRAPRHSHRTPRPYHKSPANPLDAATSIPRVRATALPESFERRPSAHINDRGVPPYRRWPAQPSKLRRPCLRLAVQDPFAGGNRVPAAPTVAPIGAATTAQLVLAGLAGQAIVTSATLDVIFPAAAADPIVSSGTDEDVVPRSADHDIRARAPAQAAAVLPSSVRTTDDEPVPHEDIGRSTRALRCRPRSGVRHRPNETRRRRTPLTVTHRHGHVRGARRAQRASDDPCGSVDR